ncbi:MAG: hypothetical protein AB7H80_11035 [Candidatus Kapaibacterium sp.]
MTEKFTAKKFLSSPFSLRTTENTALKAQIEHLQANIEQLKAEIEEKENLLNEVIYQLYDLNEEDRGVVDV